MTGEMRNRNWPRTGLILAVVVALLAIGIYVYRGMALQPSVDKAPAPPAASVVSVRSAPAAQGSISSSLSYSGDVKAASQVSVMAKGSGRIERLGVDVGSRVKKGDVLAELDSASLRSQVSQASANLAAAEARLSALTAGPRSEQVAQASAALEAALAKRDQVMKGATDAQLQASSSAVAQASASVSSARSNVSASQASVDALKAWPTQREWGQALAAVDSSKANLKAAEEKLADVRAGAKPAEIMAAEAQLEGARAALSAKKDGLDAARSGTPLSAWAATGTSLGQSQEALAAAQGAYDAAQANLALLRSRPLAWELQAAQSSVDASRASLSAASATVDQMKRGATPEDVMRAQAQVTAAENGVVASQASLATAEANYNQVREGATEEERRMVEASVAQAEQALKLASSPYRQSDFDAARAGVMQARAALDASEIALAETKVISPVDGVVAEKHLSEGQLIGPSSAIVSIVSAEVELSIGVEESQIGLISEGQRAEIAVAAYPGQTFGARVSLIAPTADPKSRTFQVKVRPEGSEGRLRAGMFAQVRVITGERQGAILVPKEALITKGSAMSLFVVKDDQVQARSVKTGITSGNQVEVTSGLSLGEEVVTSGQNDLRDGDKVKKS